jgi:uncharacterized protein YjgD (DUF1641 family)
VDAFGLSRARYAAATAKDVAHLAHPIAFQPPPRDPREALRSRLEHAPADHAEALLAAYDVLQQLHERGILDLVRSGLAAGDEVLEKIVDGANTPETTRALRNLLVGRQVLGRIEPQWFQGIFQAIPDGFARATADRHEPIGLWKLLRRATSKDSLSGLSAAVCFLESVGRHLRSVERSGAPAGR